MARRERLTVVAIQLGLAAVVLAVWIYQTRIGRVSPILLPQPERVLEEFPDLLRDPDFWSSLKVTVLELAGAFGVATAAGLLVGAVVGAWAPAARVATPLLAWAQTVPIILFYPICILIFGIGPMSKLAFGGFYGFFPIAANTVLAISTVPPRYLTAAAALGASRRHVITRVLIPAARPLILAGVRLGAALCLIGVLAGELLGSTEGLGYKIASASGGFKTPELYAYITVALVLVAIFNLAITRTEDRNAQV
ncbi:ABC transporter permease [Actinomadura syzygii]|uniref:ABC transporter permease n=1 Tax=Actinomadura syzygii TaxID=1427538 RepID=A0A5D0U563_9ACTN|nr:ABC transporter permease [Actinomadura syzygii]TYC13207.1 ABC transporter permease [Actinomadura syzygii]